jgi:hypothetical protein
MFPKRWHSSQAAKSNDLTTHEPHSATRESFDLARAVEEFFIHLLFPVSGFYVLARYGTLGLWNRKFIGCSMCVLLQWFDAFLFIVCITPMALAIPYGSEATVDEVVMYLFCFVVCVE